MKLTKTTVALLLSLSISAPSFAENTGVEVFPIPEPTKIPLIIEENGMDELDPYDPNIEQILERMDREYYEQTGELPFSAALDLFAQKQSTRCYRATCKVWAQVVKAEQKMYLYVNGSLVNAWPVSTGVRGHGTPNFDRHPNGRIYDRYTSTKYPGGDYLNLGNMPYAIFIEGGFAIHGTGKGNWKKLGKEASHGCVRVHPDNAFKFNRLVREAGIYNTWITIQ